MIADDEGPMHVIVKQIKKEAKGRSDLTGWRHNGNIVLIEIKRVCTGTHGLSGSSFFYRNWSQLQNG